METMKLQKISSIQASTPIATQQQPATEQAFEEIDLTDLIMDEEDGNIDYNISLLPEMVFIESSESESWVFERRGRWSSWEGRGPGFIVV